MKVGTGSSGLRFGLGLGGAIALSGVAHALPAEVPGEVFCSAVVASSADVAVEGRASVDGDVRAVGDVRLNGHAEVSGKVTANDDTAAFDAAGAPPGASDLGALVARKGEVVLAAGVYRADSVEVTGRARIVVDASATDPVVLYVAGDLRVAGTGSINAGGDPAALVLLSSASSALSLHGNSVVDALLYAPGASAALGGNSSVRGGVVAASVRAGGNARVASVESGCVPEPPPPSGGDPELLVSRWVATDDGSSGYSEILVLDREGAPHPELPVLASGADGRSSRNTLDRYVVDPGSGDVYYVLNERSVEAAIRVVSAAGVLAGAPDATATLVDTSLHECALEGLESTIWNVALSPDGTRMAWGWEGFGDACDDGGSTAWIYTAATRPPLGITRLLWDAEDRFFGVAWGARDGIEELYVHGQRRAGSRYESTIDAFHPVSGAFLRRLFSEIDATGACTGFLCLPLPVDWLSVSPDGASVIFQVQPELSFVTRERPLAPGVYRLPTDVAGASPELLWASDTPMGFDVAPSFAPDGSAIIVRTTEGLVTVDLAGPTASELVAIEAPPSYADQGGPVWGDVLP